MKKLTTGLVHLHDAIIHGIHDCWVRPVDTDVIVIGKFYYLQEFRQNLNIWIALGSGKHSCYYHINAICEYLSRENRRSGCDTTSAFYGWGKKSAWEAWNCFNEVTQAFGYIALHSYANLNLDSAHFQLLVQ